MSPILLLAVHAFGTAPVLEAVTGANFWEQTPFEQKVDTDQPMIRFKPENHYLFKTPELVQQGTYQVTDGHYTFHALRANQLEVADKNNAIANWDASARKQFEDTYYWSMQDFEGNYDPEDSTLTITFRTRKKIRTARLHRTDEGDNDRANTVSEIEQGIVGIWHAVEPFPDRLDARTRMKVDEFGLQHFLKEASLSDMAQLGIIDFHRDNSYRAHAATGRWNRRGSTVFIDGKPQLTVSADGQTLLGGGKPAFIRN